MLEIEQLSAAGNNEMKRDENEFNHEEFLGNYKKVFKENLVNA